MGARPDAPPDAILLASAHPAPAPPPVAEGVRDQLSCPLCAYSLRGLLEPRCPECGYAFDWAELTDPARRLHPYLFEHHPEANARSWWRTLVGGLRPHRFWRQLHPGQPSRPRRVALYALLCAFVVAVAVLGQVAVTAYRMEREHAEQRRWLSRAYARNPLVQLQDGTTYRRTAAQVQAELDRAYPTAASAQFLRHLYHDRALRWTLRHVTALLAWPALTFATLMIFRQSMARARARPIHVVRCVVYSADVAAWAALALAALLAADLVLDRGPAFGQLRGLLRPAVPALVIGACAVASWRLFVAYRLYIRMDRPLATVLAAQAIVMLVLLLLWIEANQRWGGWWGW